MNLKNVIVITTSVLLAFSAYKTLSVTTDLHQIENPAIGEAFNIWRNQHGKNYNSSEENFYRMQIFLKSYLEVKRVNDMNLSYKLGLN
jgi:C1A family cysteine protease